MHSKPVQNLVKGPEGFGKRTQTQTTNDPLFWEVWLMVFFLGAIMRMVSQSMTLGEF